MACKPYGSHQCQREGSPGQGSGWTTADASSPLHTNWAIRGRFLVQDVEGEDCTGWMHYEYSYNGGAWTQFAEVKFAEAGLLNWYQNTFAIGTSHGAYRIRIRLEYDGDEWLTTPFTITTSGEGRETVTAEAHDNTHDASTCARSQDAEAAEVTETAATVARAQDVEAAARNATAGSSPNTEEATADVREQTAGLPARSVIAELPAVAETAGAAPRAQEATAADRTQSAGAR